ncbi:hypothetical protein K3G63_11080 [Hymenobacter sp. HSC-4F20]|uniref:hypothetical protein n=1 Tax=Hymenobacter sp. HSC-4F20 TaxID=2864135 RepID=UPI001C72A8B2|nr:hypothetical protein [Hymenobacter sp. HSC-4F20]MBX0290986.1 hypothetical protein [Hymenobacter sp. HSC-4F20]
MSRTTAHLDPATQVAVPQLWLDIDAYLAYWLSNPLLPAGRVAATQQRLPLLDKLDKHKLALRLQDAVKGLRALEPYDATGYNLLLNLVRHELVSSEERVALKPHLLRLRGAEIDWEYTRLEAAIKLREYTEYDKEAA